MVPAFAEQVLEAAGIGGWELDVATGHLRWTSVTFRIHEVDPSQQPSVQEAINFYPPDARRIIEPAIERAIRDGTPWDLETPFITARGRHIRVRAKGMALRQGGTTSKLYGTFEDITAFHEQTERMARLSIVVEQMTNVVMMLDRSGRVEWVNSAFTEATGFTLEEVRRRLPSEFLNGPETDPATVEVIANGVRTGTGFEVEILNYDKQRQPHWMAVKGTPLRDEAGRPAGFITVESDITERRALAEREARLSLIAQQMSNLVVVLDRRGSVEWVNDAFTRCFGYTLDEIRGRWPGELLTGPETDLSRVDYIESCVRKGIGFETELLNYGKDGSYRRMSISGTPLRDKTGSLCGFISIETDITERIAAEERARFEAGERGRAEAMLRDILDTLPNAVTAYDADDRFVLCNRAYHELFPIAARFATPGRLHQDIIRLGMAHGQYGGIADTDEAREKFFADAVEKIRDRRPHTLRLANGRVMEVRAHKSATGTTVTVRTDTTDLHAANEQAQREAAERRQAELLLRDILDTLPTAVTAYDAQERFILCNRAYAQTYPIAARHAVPGRTLQEVMRLAVAEGQYPHAPTDPAGREAWISQNLIGFRNLAPKTLKLANGRYVHIEEGLSASGIRVTVRSDTTDLHIAEETARREAADRERAEALLRDVLDTLPVAVIAYDSDEILAMTNRALAEITPITARFARPGRRLEDVVSDSFTHGQFAESTPDPEVRAAWVADALRRLRNPTGAPRTMKLADGRVTQVRERRSQTGNLVIIRNDITDLHIAEETARREAADRERAEALLRDVLDTLPTGVIAYDSEDRVALWNRVYEEAFPIVARHAVAGRHVRDVLRLSAGDGDGADRPASPDGLEQWLDRAVAQECATGETVMPLPDGRFMQVRARRSERGTLVSVRSDITDLTRAQGLLRDVLDTLPNAVIAFDSSDRVILTNNAYHEMFPITSRFAQPGRPIMELIRLGAKHGQYPEAPGDPAGMERWVAEGAAFIRSGILRTVQLSDGRYVQVHSRRSDSGALVSVRTDVTELTRTGALLRDVLEALPTGVIAYDSDDRVVLTNRVYNEMFPIAARFATPGRPMADMIRLAAEHGHYADAPAASSPDEYDAWVQQKLDLHRAIAPRTIQTADGRTVQISGHRSDSGTLVSVRVDVTELTRTEALLRDILEALPSGVIAFDREERLVLWNNASMEMYPLTAQKGAAGLTLEQVVRSVVEEGDLGARFPSAEAREAWIAEQLAIYRAGTGERTLPLAGGRFAQARERRSQSGHLVFIRTETTELVRAQALLRDVLDALPSAVLAFDQQERLLVINRAFKEMFPISARFTTLGADLQESLRLAVQHGQFPDAGTTAEEQSAWVARWLHAYRNPGPPRIVALADGRYLQARESRSETGVIVAVRTDTTELTRAEQTMRLQAERDPLTGLANRAGFLAALDRALGEPAPGRAAAGVLLLIDVDYFKQINDTLGHDVGDALLAEIGVRLRGQLRTSDVPARLGGDEFGVIMPGLNDPQTIEGRMDHIHSALSVPVELPGRRLPIGLSVGVTMFPQDGHDGATLLKNADLALYEAKRSGRARWSAFRTEQAAALDHRTKLADALRHALLHGQITCAMQPKRWLKDGGGHAGFEALARWHDGNRWVSPGEFIPVAEETGLIGQLGRHVMEAALARARELRDLGLQPGRIAVNVTGQQLLDGRFKDETLEMLDRLGLQPADLELEITETVLLGRAAERIDAVLRDFSHLGITLALDDFGTGYASLAHLSRLPIDRLKIDQSFVAGIGKTGPGAVITRTVITLAQSLEMESIAEGVETQEQVDFLKAAGCDVVQGYFFAKPLLTMPEAANYLRGLGEPTPPKARRPARAQG
jgi:diguanylate cyclase (GGDEF)-like protein/PAS domain S-box-containing protein